MERTLNLSEQPRTTDPDGGGEEIIPPNPTSASGVQQGALSR